MKYLLLIYLSIITAPTMANDFAEIPDFSSNTSVLLIGSVRSFTPQSGGEFDDLNLGDSNGQLAIVDNIESPSCVAFLQIADNVTDANQQLIADTISLNCN